MGLHLAKVLLQLEDLVHMSLCKLLLLAELLLHKVVFLFNGHPLLLGQHHWRVVALGTLFLATFDLFLKILFSMLCGLTAP